MCAGRYTLLFLDTFEADHVQAAGMCVEKHGAIESIPNRAEVDTRMSTN